MTSIELLETPLSNSTQTNIVSFRPWPVRLLLGCLGGIPTALLLGLLIAIGWWGHHSGWSLPKFSAWNGQVAEADDWCSEHSVPESICVECDESLLPKPKAKGWCKLHGIPECTLCNPSLAQIEKKPVVSPVELDKALRSLSFAERPSNNPICKSHQRRIQFVDHDAVEKAGITVQPVWTSTAVEFVSAPGEIGFDQARVAHLSSRAAGSVFRVFKRLGETVRRGDLLALIEAGDVGKAKADLQQEYAQLLLRRSQLQGKQAAGAAVAESQISIAVAAVRESEIRVDAVRQTLVNYGLAITAEELAPLSLDQLKARLHLLGISDAMTQSLDRKNLTTNLLPLIAPQEGVIVSHDVVAGEVIDPTKIVFEIVDPKELWLTLDVKSEEAPRVKVGLPIRFRLDGSTQELTGSISWISNQIDLKTRTVKVRATLPNSDGVLRANAFGTGRIIQREEPDVVAVPHVAIHSEGCCQIVFVRDAGYLKDGAPKVFHIRKVRTGAENATHTEIIAGVMPGELIVTGGSGLLLTELLRGSLGEGCACHSKK